MTLIWRNMVCVGDTFQTARPAGGASAADTPTVFKVRKASEEQELELGGALGLEVWLPRRVRAVFAHGDPGVNLHVIPAGPPLMPVSLKSKMLPVLSPLDMYPCPSHFTFETDEAPTVFIRPEAAI